MMKNKITITYELTLDTELIQEKLEEGFDMGDIRLELRRFGINARYVIDAEVIDVENLKGGDASQH